MAMASLMQKNSLLAVLPAGKSVVKAIRQTHLRTPSPSLNLIKILSSLFSITVMKLTPFPEPSVASILRIRVENPKASGRRAAIEIAQPDHLSLTRHSY